MSHSSLTSPKTLLLLVVLLTLVSSIPTAKAQSPVRDDDHKFQQYVWSYKELKRQNVVLQKHDFSCGAASLATVLQYFWGDYVTEAEILREMVTMMDVVELKDRIENGLTISDLRKVP